MRTAEIRSQAVPLSDRTGQSSPRELFVRMRATTEAIAAPLSAEDRAVQSMPDASPTKWHLAHVTWFFETFLLAPFLPGYRRFDERYAYLFNSYYDSIGTRHPRPQRGLLTRPSAADVGRYRAYVDEAMSDLFSRSEPLPQISHLVELGINHEQQHQELMLTDILHAFACNPLYPAYHSPEPIAPGSPAGGREWFAHPAGLYDVGQTAAPPSPSTTRGRGTVSSFARSSWPRARSAMANGRHSSRMAGTVGRSCGCPTVGRRRRRKAGRRPSTGGRRRA